MDVCDEKLRGIEEEQYEGKRQNRREGKIAPKMEEHLLTCSPHSFYSK